jgi:hypothetical protein
MISPDRKKPHKGRRRTEAATFEALWKHAVKSMHAGRSDDRDRATTATATPAVTTKRAAAKARAIK